MCPDSLALIGVYGSVATGDEYGKSDLDLMILINDENGQVLADGFIIDDVDIGYDLYCTSWDMLENDAQCGHAHVLPGVVRMKEAANRGKGKTLLISAGIEIMLIICIIAANLNQAPILYFIFYNLLYGLVFSLLIPLHCLYKENGVSVSGSVLTEVGFKKPGIRQWVVLVAFVVFSVGGQLIPKMAVGEQIPWHLLPMGIVPLIMTTFFEEFLFRGFVQSRIDRQFGWVPAILVSGAMFSLYHLGYPGFRTWEDILLLFAVGVGFAAAYKLSGNNLIVSFFVNLPNAFVTYILKYEQFPVMRASSP